MVMCGRRADAMLSIYTLWTAVLAKMSIDLKFVELTANVLEFFFITT